MGYRALLKPAFQSKKNKDGRVSTVACVGVSYYLLAFAVRTAEKRRHNKTKVTEEGGCPHFDHHVPGDTGHSHHWRRASLKNRLEKKKMLAQRDIYSKSEKHRKLNIAKKNRYIPKPKNTGRSSSRKNKKIFSNRKIQQAQHREVKNRYSEPEKHRKLKIPNQNG